MDQRFAIITDQENNIEAELYATQYNLPIYSKVIDKNVIYIFFIAQQIRVCFFDDLGNKQEIIVDFVKSLALNRYRSFAKENIVKAIGKITPQDKLFDLTAGFAKDSLLLAKYGYNLHLIEKHPIIYMITAHAIKNLAKHSAKSLIVANNLQINNQDSHDYLDNMLPGNYIFYLDPMFPKISKAKVKKEMQLVQKINIPQFDLAILLDKAIRLGNKIVVKRTNDAKQIANFIPHHVIKGSKIKFEIYYGLNCTKNKNI
jgi:hypothetical protein